MTTRMRLPEGWTWARLEQLAAEEPNAITDGPFGSNLKTADYVDNGEVRVIRLGNLGVGRFVDESRSFVSAKKFAALKKHEARSGDLVIAALAEPVGRCVEVPDELGPAIVKADCIRFRVNSIFDRRYLMHALNSPAGRRRAEAAAHGMGRLRINLGDLRSLLVPTAPPAEQRRIVAKLEALQARSRRAREALDAVPPLLEKLRQSILAAAFRGDLTKDWRLRHPEVEPVSKLLQRISRPPLPSRAKSKSGAVRPGDCGLSIGDPNTPTPRGWQWVPLTEIARLESGHTPSRLRPEWWDGTIPWIGIKDARDHHGQEIIATRQNTNADGLANSAARLLPKGTVCLSRTATIGYVTVMGAEMATSQDFVNWVCTEAVQAHWLKHLFMAEKQALLRYSSQSTNVATIFYPELLAFHVCLPPLDEQREIVRRVEALLNFITSIERAQDERRTRLEDLSNSILAKAFRGQLVPQDPNDEPADVMLARLRDNVPAESPRRRGRQAKAAE